MIKYGFNIIRQFRPISIRRISYSQLSRLYSIQKIGIKSEKVLQQTQTPQKVNTLLLSSEIIDVDFEPTLTEMDEICDSSEENIRNVLYAAITPELESIHEVQTVDDFLAALHDFSDEHFTKIPVICQTILVLWDVVRVTYFDPVVNQEKVSSVRPTEMLNECFKVFEMENFKKVLTGLEQNLSKLTPDELGCCLMYLKKMGLELYDPLQQKIIEEFLVRAEREDDITLTALSRFVVTMSYTDGIFKCFACLDVIPLLYRYLDECTSVKDLCLITIALNHIAKLVSGDLLDKYQNKIRKFITQGVLKPTTTRTNLKILNLLNYPEWAKSFQKLTRDIVVLMEPIIDTLGPKELFLIQKNVKSRLEPANVVPKLVKRADHLLESQTSLELLTCSLLEILPGKRVRYIEITNKVLENLNSDADLTLPLLFKVLRLLKTSNVDLCNRYWDKVKEEIERDPNDHLKIARYTHRYMHFNNNLGGTYRHRKLEKTIINFLFNQIENGVTALIPNAFSRAVAFIIGYGSQLLTEDTIPELIIDKVDDMSAQFSIQDCYRLSRGLQIAHELRYKFFIPRKEAPHLVRIEEILNKCSNQHIKRPDLNINDLNLIVKSYNARRSSRKSSIFQEMITKYDTVQGEFNSRVIRDIVYNLTNSDYHCQAIFEQVIDYIKKNADFVTGETLDKAIGCFYTLGYIPDDEDFFKVCHQIINRDLNFMSGLSIIQSCLSLSLFKVLSEDLIHKIFNITFIKRLEEEIEACYSKETYPEKVLSAVMQLNRAVCLDFPAANVPWFQQNYIEAQMTKGK